MTFYICKCIYLNTSLLLQPAFSLFSLLSHRHTHTHTQKPTIFKTVDSNKKKKIYHTLSNLNEGSKIKINVVNINNNFLNCTPKLEWQIYEKILVVYYRSVLSISRSNYCCHCNNFLGNLFHQNTLGVGDVFFTALQFWKVEGLSSEQVKRINTVAFGGCISPQCFTITAVVFARRARNICCSPNSPRPLSRPPAHHPPLRKWALSLASAFCTVALKLITADWCY